jgi:hypothetical protein
MNSRQRRAQSRPSATPHSPQGQSTARAGGEPTQVGLALFVAAVVTRPMKGGLFMDTAARTPRGAHPQNAAAANVRSSSIALRSAFASTCAPMKVRPSNPTSHWIRRRGSGV